MPKNATEYIKYSFAWNAKNIQNTILDCKKTPKFDTNANLRTYVKYGIGPKRKPADVFMDGQASV